MNKIKLFEPFFFIFFGLFHLHRIWGLVDRASYAQFWLSVMEEKGWFYFALMGILAFLCLLGIVTFFQNLHHNSWWRWIYLMGGGYVLFDLAAIAAGWDVWDSLLRWMFDVDNPAWNWLWGGFSGLGLLSLLFGICLLYQKINMKE